MWFDWFIDQMNIAFKEFYDDDKQKSQYSTLQEI